MKKTKIKSVQAKVILDSRKKETVEVELCLERARVVSSVPSGASTGKSEALALPANRAVEKINKIIAPKLIGRALAGQKEIDNFLIKLDRTKNKSCLGANAIYGISMAVCRAGAVSENLPLYQYINKIYTGETGVYSGANKGGPEKNKSFSQNNCLSLPGPAFNIINGGAHADNNLDIQEFMIVPQGESFSANLAAGKKIYEQLKKNLLKEYGQKAIKLGDEGGFAPPFSSVSRAIEAIVKAEAAVRNKLSVSLALDCAASQFFKQGYYFLEGKKMTADNLIDFYKQLVKQYRLLSLEDPFEEEDFAAWAKITKILGRKILIIGDDLLTSNPGRIKKAEQTSACNAMILKVNQIGTVSEALQAARLARSFGWSIMVSHRSGETMDDFIADLAVGIKAEFIKSGAPFPKERMAKYNRLLIIEKELTEK